MASVDAALRLELEDLVVRLCRAVNDPKRLLVMYALREGPRTVTQLCRILGTPQSNTSQHLAVLRDRGLVDTTRSGNMVIYSLRHPRVIDAIDILRGVMNDELELHPTRAGAAVTSAPPDVGPAV